MRMQKTLVTFFVFICTNLPQTELARILGIFPYEGKSHFVMFENLMKGLAKKGHEVVVLSHWPQKIPLKNYEDRSLIGSRTITINNVSLHDIESVNSCATLADFILNEAGSILCEDVYQHPAMQQLIAKKEKFDVLINEMWGSDCFLPLAAYLRIPHISITSMVTLPWAMSRYGHQLNPAYETTYFTPLRTSGMNFGERILNTIVTYYLNLRHYIESEIPSEKIAKKFLGDSIPPLRQIINNSSLLLVNSHFSVNSPRPFPPNIIEVAGLHIPEPKPLPEDIKSFLKNSKNGVIIFSLGSLVKLESLGSNFVESIVKAFSTLEYDVLWKFRGKLDHCPSNLKVVDWLPQSDVLRHPNVKLFITHGGLMGTQEALVVGVPLIVIPFFGDQQYNAENYVDMGIGIQLDYKDIQTDNFLSAIRTVLNNKTYSDKAQFYSELFNDRPQSALDTAIYWVEYVIRYQGAPHLHPAVKKLNWYQASLLDVYLFFLSIVLLVFYIVRKLLTCICLMICSNNYKKLNNQKEKKI